jgi:hypothetical protein
MAEPDAPAGVVLKPGATATGRGGPPGLIDDAASG